MRVGRALGDAEGSVCFSAIVRDLTGKFAGGDAPGVCTKTVPPPFFYGCGAARGAGSSDDTRAAATIALVAAVLVRRRRTSA